MPVFNHDIENFSRLVLNYLPIFAEFQLCDRFSTDSLINRFVVDVLLNHNQFSTALTTELSRPLSADQKAMAFRLVCCISLTNLSSISKWLLIAFRLIHHLFVVEFKVIIDRFSTDSPPIHRWFQSDYWSLFDWFTTYSSLISKWLLIAFWLIHHLFVVDFKVIIDRFLTDSPPIRRWFLILHLFLTSCFSSTF